MAADVRAEEVFNADHTLTYLDPPARRSLKKLVAVTALAVYLAYLIYRGLYTLNPDALVFSLLVYGAEIHGFLAVAFYFFQLWEQHGRNVPSAPEGLSVDVFITTYNEDLELLRQTIRAAVAMRYPHRTYVLDDGRRASVRTLAEELGCGYLTRDTNQHAKAGNWNNAFAQTIGTLIATFDADHVPRADFLDRTLGFFRDPRVALVQVPQRYHNLDSIQHRINWATRRIYGEQDVFFDLVLPGKEHWNASFFCGTGAVLRREALKPHGGQTVGSVTEDVHTSIVLHADGWKSVYVNETLVTGLAPVDFPSFQSQRLRWAEGNLQILGHINPLTAKGLRWGQRICYVASMFHWTTGIPKLIFYIAPPWILYSGSFPIRNFNGQFLWIYAAFLSSWIIAYKILSRGTGRLLMDELFNMANFFTLIRALTRQLVRGRKPGRFVVTDKRGTGRRAWREVLPHYGLIALSGLALAWNWSGRASGVNDDVFGSAVCSFWALYNMGLMGGVVAMSLRPPQKRHSFRVRAAFPVESHASGSRGYRVAGVTVDVSDGGCTLLWPHPLLAGTRWPFVMHLGSERLRCQMDVVSTYGQRGRWTMHGMRFVNQGQPGIDLVNDAAFNLAVPELLHRLSEPSVIVRVLRQLARRFAPTFSARPGRHRVALPVRIYARDREFLTTTRDVSAVGLNIVSPEALAVDSTVAVAVLTPAGEWRGQATVTRCGRAGYASDVFETWSVGLSMDLAADLAAARSVLLAEAT